MAKKTTKGITGEPMPGQPLTLAAVEAGVAAQGVVVPPGGMVVGKIEVNQDLSAERAAGAPHAVVQGILPPAAQALTTPPGLLSVTAGIGAVVLFQVDSEIYRPLLISVVESPTVVSGQVFFSPDDNKYAWVQTGLRQRLAPYDCTRWLEGVRRGDYVGGWRFLLP